MKLFHSMKDRGWVPYTIAACSAVLLYWILSHLGVFLHALGVLGKLVTPVVYAAVFAYLLNPVAKFFHQKLFHRIKSERTAWNLSVAVALVFVIALITTLMVALIPQVIASFSTLLNNAGDYVISLQQYFTRIEVAAARFGFDLAGTFSKAEEMILTFVQNLPDHMEGIILTSYNIGLGVFNVIIAAILAIYFLCDKDRMRIGARRLFHALIRDKAYHQMRGFVGKCNHIMLRYVACDILDGLIVGVSNWIFMMIIGMPYTILVSLVVGVTNLAPTFGPIVGAIIGSMILVLVNPWYALGFLIFTILLQTADGYILKPKLFGNLLGVSSVWILIAIIVFGRIFGVGGILLAIPAAAILDFVYDEILIVALEKRHQENEQKKSGSTAE